MNKIIRRFLGIQSFLFRLHERQWLLNAVFCHKRAIKCTECLPVSPELTCMFNCFSLCFLCL